MKFDRGGKENLIVHEYKRNLERQLGEERERRFGRERSSEELLRQKSSDDRENRPVLTGYKPLKEEDPSLKETLRMENSRGILAMGGDERKRPALVVTEKFGPHGPAGTERERILQEKGERDYPEGASRTIANPGEREEGAVGFLLRPAMTHRQMIGNLKRYMEEHDQKTLGHMMPFLVTEKELAGKRKLEEAVQEIRREGQEPGQEAWRGQESGQKTWQEGQESGWKTWQEERKYGQEKVVEMLDRLLEEKKEELIRKRQTETCFGQKLEKAMGEEKKTVWKDFSGQGVGTRKVISASSADGLSDDSADEEEPAEQNLDYVLK